MWDARAGPEPFRRDSQTGGTTLQTGLEVLLLEPDFILAERLAAELIERFRITVHAAQNHEQALSFVQRNKLEGVFIALDHAYVDVLELIRDIRGSKGNSSVPIVVFAPNEALQPLADAAIAGADHFLVKPLIRPQLYRLMRTLYERMVDSRRRYQRAPVDFPVLCSAHDEREVGTGVNLSASGILLEVGGKLKPSDNVELTFPFNKQMQDPFVVPGQVSRVQGGSQVAVSFADLPPEQLSRLKIWVEMALFCEPVRLN